jgi:hypothetical protein
MKLHKRVQTKTQYYININNTIQYNIGWNDNKIKPEEKVHCIALSMRAKPASLTLTYFGRRQAMRRSQRVSWR